MIRPGMKGTAELTVGDEHTAPRIGSDKVRVLATPVMINLIEAAALAAVEHLLPAGYQSLGTRLDVPHVAATRDGMRVIASAGDEAFWGRDVTFQYASSDGGDPS